MKISVSSAVGMWHPHKKTKCIVKTFPARGGIDVDGAPLFLPHNMLPARYAAVFISLLLSYISAFGAPLSLLR